MVKKLTISFISLLVILFIVWANSDITKHTTKLINPFLPFNPEPRGVSEQNAIKLFNCIDNYYRNENSYIKLIKELFCDSINWEYIGAEKQILKLDIKNHLGSSTKNHTLVISPIITEKSLKSDLEIINFDIINIWVIEKKENRKCYHISLTFENSCIKEFHRTESTIECKKYLWILDNLTVISSGLYIILIFLLTLLLSFLFKALGQENKSNLVYFISLIFLIVLSNKLGISNEILEYFLPKIIK